MKPERAVLVVEDDDDDFFFTHRILRKFTAAPVLRVTNGHAAINYLAGRGDYADRQAYPLPGFMFLDLKMDAGSGHEVLAWVQANLAMPRPAIFVLTGSNEPRDRERVKASGAAAGYIVKPLTPDHVRPFFAIATPGVASPP
jgi:CheY-like chemotaxis protein